MIAKGIAQKRLRDQPDRPSVIARVKGTGRFLDEQR